MAKGKNFHQMSHEELQEAGRKGGIKSGEAKRRKKTMRKTLEILLDLNLKSGKAVNIEDVDSFAAIAGQNVSVEEAILIRQIQNALKGDLNAAYFVRDTSGQKPDKSDMDKEEQQARIDKLKAETARIKGEDPEADKQDDGFIAALRGEVEDIWDET